MHYIHDYPRVILTLYILSFLMCLLVYGPSTRNTHGRVIARLVSSQRFWLTTTTYVVSRFSLTRHHFPNSPFYFAFSSTHKKPTPALSTILEDPLEAHITEDLLPDIPAFSEEEIASLASTFLPDDQANARTGLEDLIFAAMEADVEPDVPKTFKQVLESEHKDRWLQAMKDEINSITDHKVFELVPRGAVPAGRKVLKGKWVFSLKRNSEGEIVKFKARFVACGYAQIEGQDYHETTSPTARIRKTLPGYLSIFSPYLCKLAAYLLHVHLGQDTDQYFHIFRDTHAGTVELDQSGITVMYIS